MTYLELLDKTEQVLKRRGLNKSIILNIIYQVSDNIKSLYDLTTVINDEIEANQLKKILDAFEEHVIDGKPIAYILGSVEFCGNTFDVDNNVLPPRPETEEWTKILIDIVKDRGEMEMLDLCCGTGVIGLSTKLANKYIDVTLSDISRQAYENTIKNAKKHNLDVNIVLGNLFENIKEKKFDIIAFNPPYVDTEYNLDANVSKYEPYNAIYAPKRGLWFYEAILSNIKKYLKQKYLVIMEIGFNLGYEVSKMIKHYLGTNNFDVLVDSNGVERVILINNL